MAGFLESLSGPDAQRRLGAGSTVVVPIGAIEQHGPHLPLAVDHVIADAAARAVVDRLGDELDVWVAPTLPYSKSNEHAWAPGTVWLSNDTMLRVLDDMARSLAFSGVQRLVFLNGHGGNTPLLSVVCREARLHHGLLTFVVHPFVPPAYAPLDPGLFWVSFETDAARAESACEAVGRDVERLRCEPVSADELERARALEPAGERRAER